MKDVDKTKEQLINELVDLRQRVAELEASEAERKRAEEALRESEEELRAIFDGVGDGIALIDLTGKVVRVNKRITDVGGYTEEEIVGKRFELLKIFPPQSLAKVLSSFTKLISGRQIPPFEVQVYTKAGEKMDVELRGSLLRRRGKAVGMVGVMRNITERKRMEEALREAEQEKETILDSLVEHVIHEDMEMKVLWANQAACESVSLAREELIGCHCYEIWPKRSGPCPDCPVVKAIETGQPQEVEKTTPDGRAWFIRGYPARDEKGDIVGGVEVTLEITERKQLQQEIEERRLYLESVLACAPDAIVSLDGQHKIVEWNPGAERLFGYALEEVVGRDIDELITGSYAEVFGEATGLTRRVLGREDIPPTETIRYRKDGSPVDVIVAASPILIANELVGVVATYTDVSKLKRAEEALRRRAEELAALQATVLDITAPHDLPLLLQVIVERAVGLLDTPSGGMYLCDPDQKEARCVVSYNTPRDYTGTVLKYGEGAAGIVAQTGEPLIIDDYRTWSRRAAVYEEEQPFIAVLSAPMIWQGRVTGVIHVLDDVETRPFTQADLELLTLFANHAAIAVENARLHEAEQKRRHVAETLRRASTILSSTLELDEVLGLILQQLREVIPYDSASVQRLQGEHLEIVACQGFEEPDEVVGLVFPLEPKFPNYRTVTTKAPLAIEDIPRDYPHFKDEAGRYESGHIRSWLGVPLVVKDQVIGMIALDRTEMRPYTAEESELAMAFAIQAAAAIENARLFELTQRQSERLAQTLAFSESLHRGLELEQVLEQIAQGAVKLGFCRAAINICQPEKELVRIQAVAGLEGPERERLMGATYRWSEFQSLMQERFRVSRSYLIRQGALDWERDYQGVVVSSDIEDRGPGYWRPEDALLVPLWGIDGQPVGVLWIDEPVNGLLPDLNTIQTLEAFANQAAIAIENARLYQVIQRELAERKRAEEEIRKLSQFQERIIDSAGVWLNVLDAEANIVIWNKAAEEISGYSREEVVGHNKIWEWLYPDEEYRSEIVLGALAIIQKGGEEHDTETTIRGKDGQTRIISWHSRNLVDEKGTPIGSIALGHDITERRQLEAQLVQAQKMEAIGQLAGGIAHDFNNLLTPISGFAELLLWKAPEGSQQREYLRQIKVAAERAGALTRQLRLFTRQAAGERRPTQLNSVVEETHDLLKRSISKQITVELNLVPDLRMVEADPTQVGQVLMNLCLNACDAMPNGGILTLETRNVTLDEEYARQILAAQPGHYVRLSVSDTGIGMGPEVQARLFEPFFTTKEVGRGTGLGLAVVYGIVKGHGGFINVYSQEDQGSTFQVYLPAVELGGEERAAEELELPAGTETILLVDDEEMVRALGQRVLEHCGYTTLLAENGVQALEVYQAHREEIALVVLDVVMPGMGGQECMRRLQELDSQVKVLISTGYTAKDLAQELMAEGALGVVEKPFLLQDFATAVRKTIDG